MSDLKYLSDYVEIRGLNARYNRLADSADGKAYANLFTEDAEFHIVGNRIYHGRSEIARACDATRVTVHVTTEPELEIEGDTARQRVRMLSIYRAENGSRNEFVSSGWYIDELKRSAEGWRYHRRRVELDLGLEQVFAKMSITEAFHKLASES